MVSGTTRAAAAARARGGRRGASSGIPPRRQPPAVVLLGAMLLVSCGGRVFSTGPSAPSHRDDDLYVPGTGDSIDDDDAHGLLGGSRGFGSGATTVSVAQLRGAKKKKRPSSPFDPPEL